MILNHFTTQRLSVGHWQAEIADTQLRRRLEADLAAVLTPAVLAPLPPSMQLEGNLATWIDARRAESEVLLVRRKHDYQLIGLMILAFNPEASELPTVHIGYLFAEAAWGRGYATELLSGFVVACKSGEPIRLVAGVERSNPASARVLQKSGFLLLPEQSSATADMYFRDIV